MRYSGILVTTQPGGTTDVARRLALLPGVGVHHVDDAGGRLVVVHEAPGLDAHEAMLRSIQTTPGVWAAGLVRHAEDGGQSGADIPGVAAVREEAR